MKTLQILNEYEYENSKEEKLLEYYNEMDELGERGVVGGIREALNILEIKIKGINC